MSLNCTFRRTDFVFKLELSPLLFLALSYYRELFVFELLSFIFNSSSPLNAPSYVFQGVPSRSSGVVGLLNFYPLRPALMLEGLESIDYVVLTLF